MTLLIFMILDVKLVNNLESIYSSYYVKIPQYLLCILYVQ